jgi:hypothetical protein
MSENKNKQLFFSLVYSFQMQAMIQLGKLANPVTGKVEKDLEAARVTIDMVDMIKEKTENNLEEDEKRFINQVAGDLKLNFVEENAKEEEVKKDGEKEEVIETGNKAEKEDEEKSN